MQWTFDTKDEVKLGQKKTRLLSYLKYKVTGLFRIHLKTKKNEKLLCKLYKGTCWNFQLCTTRNSSHTQCLSWPLAYQNSPI